MDTTTPITPDLDGFRAKVLAIKPRQYYCCICHGKLGTQERGGNLIRGGGICNRPACFLQASRLEWL